MDGSRSDPLTSQYDGPMSELQRLRAEHAAAILAFEVSNRSYFTAFISDRGDDYFNDFAARFGAELDLQEAGSCILHVAIDESGEVLGRFNLYDVAEGDATVGYRVASHAAGRGVATAAVTELCRLATTHYGLRRLRAATSLENIASQRVLAKTGFIPVGPAELAGRPGTWYERLLV